MNTCKKTLSWLTLLGFLATSALAGDADQVPAKRIPLASGQGPTTSQFIPSSDAPVLPPALGATTCIEIRVSASGFLFADDFERGDTSAWNSSSSGALFSVSRFLDLQFEVLFAEGATGDHLLHLNLQTPRGHSYQTLTAPVTSQAVRNGALRRVDGYPYGLTIQRMITPSLAADAAGNPVTFSLPVAGTAIVSNGLYGEWTAKAFTDNETEPCSTVSFTLKP